MRYTTEITSETSIIQNHHMGAGWLPSVSVSSHTGDASSS
jgi:hypothetical protein